MNIGQIMMLVGELLICMGFAVALIGVAIYFYLKGLK